MFSFIVLRFFGFCAGCCGVGWHVKAELCDKQPESIMLVSLPKPLGILCEIQ